MQRILAHYDKLYYETLDMTDVETFGEDAVKVNYASYNRQQCAAD